MPDQKVTIEITPGEFFDRWTILAIKLERVDDDKKLAVLNEKTVLEGSNQYLMTSLFEDPKTNALVRELQLVNENLWAIEDNIRAMDQKVFREMGNRFVPVHRHTDCGAKLDPICIRYMELARSVYVTNDKRSMLKNAINSEWNVVSEVKQYENYTKEGS